MAVVEGCNEQEPLIPGLPDEIAELCLLHVPYPYHSLVRSVSSSWNRAITNPSFIVSKKTLSHPHLFVFAFHRQTAKVRCQALDPSSGRWFVLPQIPLPEAVYPTAFACASLPRQGKLFVVAPMRTTLVYSTAANRWSAASPMPGGKSCFAAEGVNGRIVTVGGNGTEIYDPESDRWTSGKAMGSELERYEAAVVGERMYIAEVCRWLLRPRGGVYEVGNDTWREMGVGMRDGWTGVSVAAGGRVFVIFQYGDWQIKVYDQECDTWRCVGGDRFPREVMQRPFAAKGLDDRIYVVSLGLNVAIGSVVLVNNNNNDETWKRVGLAVKVMWEVVEAPQAFHEFSPCSCQVLYA